MYGKRKHEDTEIKGSFQDNFRAEYFFVSREEFPWKIGGVEWNIKLQPSPEISQILDTYLEEYYFANNPAEEICICYSVNSTRESVG